MSLFFSSGGRSLHTDSADETHMVQMRLNLTLAIWSNGNTPKIGWNRGWGPEHKMVQDRTKVYDGLVGSRLRFCSYTICRMQYDRPS